MFTIRLEQSRGGLAVGFAFCRSLEIPIRSCSSFIVWFWDSNDRPESLGQAGHCSWDWPEPDPYYLLILSAI